MRGRPSTRRSRTAKNSARSGVSNGDLARFALEEHCYRLVLCDQDHPADSAEVTRFRVCNMTVAVLLDDHQPQSPTDVDDMIERLTDRELQIAALVAQGHATKNIAHTLRISEWTVTTHMKRIFLKLNVDNRAAMVFRCAPILKGISSSLV